MPSPRRLSLAAAVAAVTAVAFVALLPLRTAVVSPDVADAPVAWPQVAAPAGPFRSVSGPLVQAVDSERPEVTVELTPRQQAGMFWSAAAGASIETAERWPALKQAVAWELRALGVDPRPVRRELKRWLPGG